MMKVSETLESGLLKPSRDKVQIQPYMHVILFINLFFRMFLGQTP